MKLKGAVVDRMREVLGGKTPTEKRMKDLLAEVETLRNMQIDQATRANLPPRIEPPDAGSGAATDTFLPPVSNEIEVPAPEVPITTQADTTMAIMMATIKNLEAKVTELSKPRTAEEKDEAIGAGRLPIVAAPAAPLGYSGSAELPRGAWFVSPYGPKIKMRLCDCAQCTPFRLQHYYCVTCQKGPIDYQQRNPQGRKIWLAPGATWGISHEACSVVCYMRYMELIGVVAGVNEYTAPGQAAGEGPERPVLAMGSD